MLAAQVHWGRCDGHLDASGAEHARRPPPGDAADSAGAQWRRCGREIRALHGVAAVVRRRHLRRCAVPVFGEIRPKRDRGPFGAGPPTTTPRGAGYEPGTVRRLINATVTGAARKRGGSAETLDGLLARGIGGAVDGDAWERLGGMGRDAIALQRGPRDVVVVVTGPREAGGVEMVAGLAARQKETVAAFLRAVPATRRRTSARAGTEMDEGFGRAIEEEGPGPKSSSRGSTGREPTATAPTRGASRHSSGSSAHGPQPRTPRSKGRGGRFASGLGISNRRSGTCASGSSVTRRRSRPPSTCGKT
jgi:hypothetical protein